MKSEVNNLSKPSRLRQIPQLKNFMDTNVSCISPCSRYTENITCSLCNFLLEVGEEWKEKPEDVFVDRLEYSCTAMDFMYPVCNMIVEENSDKLYNVLRTGVAHRKACGELELCLPSDQEDQVLQE
uniref:Saposin B-type domain-containing protein n=1 Tax=Syphacia muris TaxID=451379 RepID=A0A0N5AWX1_9BILA